MSSESEREAAAKAHWDAVWGGKTPEDVSWFQPSPTPSLRALEVAGVGPEARLVDVGGGASRLVDALLERGFRALTVVDLAEAALEAAKARLGGEAEKVRWVAGDVRALEPEAIGPVDVWHDRAVFHFLTEAEDRARYRRLLEATLVPGGVAIVATFAPDGPEKCSGLPVRRWSAEALAEELGLALVEGGRETHETPWGSEQRFQWAVSARFAR